MASSILDDCFLFFIFIISYMFIGCLHGIHTRHHVELNENNEKCKNRRNFFFLSKTFYYKCWQCFIIISVPLLLQSALWLRVWYCVGTVGPTVLGAGWWVGCLQFTQHTQRNILFHGGNIFLSMQSHSIINAIYYYYRYVYRFDSWFLHDESVKVNWWMQWCRKIIIFSKRSKKEPRNA